MFVVDTQRRAVVPDVSIVPPSPQLSSLYETVTTSKTSREPTLNVMPEEQAAEVGSGKLSQCTLFSQYVYITITSGGILSDRFVVLSSWIDRYRQLRHFKY